jgi:hypothetical protein
MNMHAQWIAFRDNRREQGLTDDQINQEWEGKTQAQPLPPTSMNIQVFTRNVYGNPLIYPANNAARTLAALVSRKTLNATDLQLAQALGLTLEYVPDVQLANKAVAK